MALQYPEVEVTCDTKDCDVYIYLPLEWSVGGYDITNSILESTLFGLEWEAKDGKHYCDECVTTNRAAKIEYLT